MWQPASDAPEGVVLMTKIDDGAGARNEQPLKRIGPLWWYADDEMYVYYTPTHCRRLTPTEQDGVKSKLLANADKAAMRAHRLQF